MIGVFCTSCIDQDEGATDEGLIQEDGKPIPKFICHITGHKLMQLKNNFMPKGLVHLEQLFDKNDSFVKPVIRLKA